MEEDFSKFRHIKAWLDTGKQDASERRTNDRVRNVDVKGWYKKAEDSGEVDGKNRSSFVLAPTRVVDISPSGISIRAKDPLAIGDKIFISLKFADEKNPHQEIMIKVLCEAVRCKNLAQTFGPDPIWNENYTIGLRYVDLDPEHKKILEEFLQKKK